MGHPDQEDGVGCVGRCIGEASRLDITRQSALIRAVRAQMLLSHRSIALPVMGKQLVRQYEVVLLGPHIRGQSY